MEIEEIIERQWQQEEQATTLIQQLEQEWADERAALMRRIEELGEYSDSAYNITTWHDCTHCSWIICFDDLRSVGQWERLIASRAESAQRAADSTHFNITPPGSW